jgi:hypothetical protein
MHWKQLDLKKQLFLEIRDIKEKLLLGFSRLSFFCALCHVLQIWNKHKILDFLHP